MFIFETIVLAVAMILCTICCADGEKGDGGLFDCSCFDVLFVQAVGAGFTVGYIAGLLVTYLILRLG